MANVKSGTDKGGKKSVTTSSKAGKNSSKPAVGTKAKSVATTSKKEVEPKVKKAAVKNTGAKTPASASPSVKKTTEKKQEPASKATKKSLTPVKEKTSSSTTGSKAKDTTAKKKAAVPKSGETAAAKTGEKKSAPAKQVKIPKISATSSVPYEPDFTHSVLDTPKEEVVEASTPTLRYSDVELLEFKNLIQRKLDTAKKELAYLQGLITRKDEMGGDDDSGRYMTMEDGSLSMEREQLSQMASRQIQFIDHLEKALMRVENKTYGVCRVTGKLIEKARLRAVPHATLSMEAKTGKTRIG